jgi:cyclophilin family peptidyl-prolyl cis-trans isomerase
MLVAMLIAFLALQAAAVAPAPAPKAPSEIVAAAPAADWIDIAPEDLLIMQLAPGAQNKERKVVIQLMPPPFSQPWIANIRTLAKAHWWDGTSINRVQDNYVVQWGDATEKKPLPAGLTATNESGYLATNLVGLVPRYWSGGRVLNAPYYHIHSAQSGPRLAGPYAEHYTFVGGMPVALTAIAENIRSGPRFRPDRLWPVHCYGMIGVGRNLSPDAGSGAELYTVIGHAPRHLDRNIAVVGRVVEGIEHLSSLPRGTGALGFYEDPKQRVPIASIRLASELPEAERPRMQYLSTESASFAAYADARANRKDAFFNVPAGGADICNVPVPIRRKP